MVHPVKPRTLVTALLVTTVLVGAAYIGIRRTRPQYPDGHSQGEEKPGPKVAEFQAKTPVYYMYAGDPDQRVRLSAAMAAKVIEIVGRKPRAWTPWGGPKAAPAGYFVVGKHSYACYGFLYLEVSEDPMWGHTWDDPTLAKFCEELVGRGAELSRLKDFEP